jgi:hypothetical protein
VANNKGYGREVYLEAYKRLGSYKAVARELGVHESGVRRSLKDIDPAVRAGMDALGMQVQPGVAWIKTKPTEWQPGYSYMVKIGDEEIDVLDRIREAFADLKPAEPTPAPAYADEDLLTVYPLADVHIGMQAWGRETGEDYDTNIAAARVRSWIGMCINSAPDAHTAVIVDVGDLTHADDQTNATPRSKHVLDVATRFYRTIDITVETLGASVDLALQKHARVIVKILPGNHNPHSYLAILFALAQRYRNEPRVTVEKEPGEFWVHEHGRVMLAAHHGDKAKADRMVHFLADQYAEMWGRTKHRYLFTGHLHHHKSQDIGGVQWEQLRAITARDAYAASHAYTARAQMQAITYHRERGEIQRVKVGL